MNQLEALGILHSGSSVLLTGAAGTGKTYTLNRFIKEAKSSGKKIAVTATTGIAATHLGGTTIHSWSGLGIRDEINRSFVKNLPKSRLDNINKTDILIIDEISMLHDYRLDLLNELLQIARDNKEYFGGLQVILCGDMFQLPPVNRQGDSRQGSFVTNSQVWLDDFFDVCYLTEQYRARNDQSFSDFLNNMRTGKIMRSELQMLQSRIDAPIFKAVEPTRLFSHNANVEYLNEQELAKLNSTEMTYEMIKSGKSPYIDSLMKSVLVPESLVLKKGARVMFVKNSAEKKYVNGSIGEVIDFSAGSKLPVVKLTNGNVVVASYENWELRDGDTKRASVTQIPLRLAWAITVHKCQGMTLDAAVIDLSKAFVEGMGYVALSRVGGFEDLSLSGLNGMSLRMSQEAIDIEVSLRKKSEQTLKFHQKLIDKYIKQPPKADIKSVDSLSNFEKMRQNYPNAYRRWTDSEDQQLLQKFHSGCGLKELATAFGRQPGGIRSRIAKLVSEDAAQNMAA